MLDKQIIELRQRSFSFSAIGVALGMSKQAAHKRWRRLVAAAANADLDSVFEVQFEESLWLDQLKQAIRRLIINPNDPDFRPRHEDIAVALKVE